MIPPESLAGLGPFVGASAPAVAVLARHAVELRFGADEVVFRAGSVPRGWYVLLDGCVRVVRGGGARQHVVHTERRGGTLGEVPLFAGGTMPATAVAAEPTRCALFTPDALDAAMAAHPEVARLLLRRLALRVRTLVDRLDGRSTRDVQARLAAYLAGRLADAPAHVISLGMTQGALAEELGTVREVVSRGLRTFVQTGTLEALGHGRYRVLDPEALRSAVSS